VLDGDRHFTKVNCELSGSLAAGTLQIVFINCDLEFIVSALAAGAWVTFAVSALAALAVIAALAVWSHNLFRDYDWLLGATAATLLDDQFIFSTTFAAGAWVTLAVIALAALAVIAALTVWSHNLLGLFNWLLGATAATLLGLLWLLGSTAATLLDQFIFSTTFAAGAWVTFAVIALATLAVIAALAVWSHNLLGDLFWLGLAAATLLWVLSFNIWLLAHASALNNISALAAGARVTFAVIASAAGTWIAVAIRSHDLL